MWKQKRSIVFIEQTNKQTSIIIKIIYNNNNNILDTPNIEFNVL